MTPAGDGEAPGDADGNADGDAYRSSGTLGIDGVPALDPLSYPGPMIGEPVLLSGSRLLELTPTPERMDRWRVAGARELQDELGGLGQAPVGERYPLIAIGSNAAPGQLRHKLHHLGVPAVVPMTPLRVSGVGVGVSAHVGTKGYVAHAPFVDPGAVTDVVLTLVDEDQLQAVDDTEIPRYRRILLPGSEFPMVLPSGERLAGAYLYANAFGVLAGPDGKPRTPTTQAALLTELLEWSAPLLRLFGTPQEWVTKARADPELRAVVKQIFHESGWVLPQEALLRHVCEPGAPVLTYDALAPLVTDSTSP